MAEEKNDAGAAQTHEGFQNEAKLPLPSIEATTLNSRPVIETFDENNMVVGGTIVLGSEGGLWIIEYPGGGEISSSTPTATPGWWYLNLNPELKSGAYTIAARRFIPGPVYLDSDPKEITIFGAPNIETPVEGEVVNGRELVNISGNNAAPGQTLRFTRGPANVGPDLGVSEPARSDGTWQIQLDLTKHEGPFSFRVAHGSHGVSYGKTSLRHINLGHVIPPPVIEVPQSGAVTDPRGELSGSGGVAGALVEVLKDLEHSFKIGEGTVGANGQWSVTRFDRDMPPGPFSIVAWQIYEGKPSEISPARGFKVRPPKLTAVSVTFPTETTVKFSGAGHTGATIEITVVSGPGGTAPPAAQVTAGKWETTATNWPFGTYNLKAIQKVSDNANGWIESQPYTFSVDRGFPDPYDVTYTKDYQPTFSGKGLTGATVMLYNPDGTSKAVPDARVSNGVWSSRASDVWGPTFEREVHIQQTLNDQTSPNWVILNVTIAPLAPVMNEPVENGLSPNLSGICWPGAVLKLKYSDSPTEHAVDNQNGTWSYRRAEPFESGKTHTATITQTAAQQTSPAASKTFVVNAPIPQPVITEPEADSEVGRDVTIKGDSGMDGATMQLRDAQFGGNLGEPKRLTGDGAWSIDLTGLDYREYTIDARQTFNQQESERSEMRTFKAVLLPPVITLPKENGDLPRTAMIEGWAMPNGRVEVRLEGVAEPLLTNIPVGPDGRWKAEVTLPVGAKTIRARQTADGQASKDSQALNYNVVPAAPYLETPAAGERVGRRVVVSGFGVPGDTVTVKLGDVARQVRAQSPVLEDRTWSVTVEIDQPGGRYGLVAVASCEGFESVDSPVRNVELGTYLPSFDRPAAGHRVSNPVRFQGQGRPGGGQVISWFNPDLSWTAAFTFTTVGWQAPALGTLPSGGNWCRFFEVFSGEGESIYSDTVETSRFDVLPPSAQS
ncbi:hypothetical protein [Pseudomonas sp. NPDC086278]|uniref:hypothetical protein n=1 Tax=Pseudomonas sp. NPDC086278 TaxID=3390646 RepID=UPI003D05B42A